MRLSLFLIVFCSSVLAVNDPPTSAVMGTVVSVVFTDVRDGNISGLRQWSAQGINLGDLRHEHLTLATYAAAMGNIQVLQFLLELRVDLRASDDLGYSPTTRAAAAGRHDVVEWLVKHARVPVGDYDANGNSPIVIAIVNGHGNGIMPRDPRYVKDPGFCCTQ